MTTCEKCGHKPAEKQLGRPKTIDDAAVKFFRRMGWSMAKIAAEMGVSKGAVQGSVKRTKGKKR